MTIAEKMIEEWNENNPIGTPVLVRRDNGDIERLFTRSSAWMLGGHTPVVQVQGIVGCYALERVSAVVDPVKAKADLLQQRLDEFVAWLKEQLTKTCAAHRTRAFNEVLDYLGQTPVVVPCPVDAPVPQGYKPEAAASAPSPGSSDTADMLSRGCVIDGALYLTTLFHSVPITVWNGMFEDEDIFVTYRNGNVRVEIDGETKIEFHDEDFATMQTTLQALLRVELCRPHLVVMWSKRNKDVKWEESR